MSYIVTNPGPPRLDAGRMSKAALRQPVSDPAVAIGDTPDILDSILQPTVQLALWRRSRPSALAWLDAMTWTAIEDIDAVIDGPAFAGPIARHLSDACYPDNDAITVLVEEIARLALHYATLAGRLDLRLRLEVIETDACRKFHMDNVTLRLIMPLVGPGTQWIDLADGESPLVHQLDPGHVGIFRGRRSVDEPRILHRSPPIAGTGQSRLLLVLEPLSDPDEA
jgi:hypothetical protein